MKRQLSSEPVSDTGSEETLPAAGGGQRRSRRLLLRLGTLLIIIVLLALLQVAGELHIGGGRTIPTTLQVFRALGDIVAQSATYSSIEQTFTTWCFGFGLSVVGGVAISVLLSLSRFATRSTRGLFDFLRSTPAVALIPPAVLALGTGDEFKVALIIFACIWTVLLQTTAGLRSVDPVSLDSALSVRMNRLQRIRWVLLPTALPYLLTGVRLAAVQGFLVCIGAEYLAGSPGLGQQIFLRELGGAVPGMWAFVMLTAGLGVLVSAVFTVLESRVLSWHVSQRDLAA